MLNPIHKSDMLVLWSILYNIILIDGDSFVIDCKFQKHKHLPSTIKYIALCSSIFELILYSTEYRQINLLSLPKDEIVGKINGVWMPKTESSFLVEDPNIVMLMESRRKHLNLFDIGIKYKSIAIGQIIV